MATDPSSLALAALVAIITFTVYLALDSYLRKRKQSSILKNRIGAPATFGMARGDEKLISMEQEKSPTAILMENMLKMVGVDTEAALEFVQKRFSHAGMQTVNGPVYYLFMQRIASVFFIIISIPFFNSSAEGTKFYADIFLGLLIIILGIFGPYIMLENKIQKRKKVLIRSFPDALDLLLVCVESGLALDASLSRVCRELDRAHPVVTKELNRTRLELALLNDRTRALTNLGDRTDLVPFRSLAAALIQTEKFGTSLSDTLRVLSDDYRQTRLLMAENKANRLPALITIPLITLLMPAFIMIILGPAIVRVKSQGGMFGHHSSKSSDSQ